MAVFKVNCQPNHIHCKLWQSQLSTQLFLQPVIVSSITSQLFPWRPILSLRAPTEHLPNPTIGKQPYSTNNWIPPAHFYSIYSSPTALQHYIPALRQSFPRTPGQQLSALPCNTSLHLPALPCITSLHLPALPCNTAQSACPALPCPTPPASLAALPSIPG